MTEQTASLDSARAAQPAERALEGVAAIIALHFALLAPLFCLFFDPLVFRYSWEGQMLLGQYRMPLYRLPAYVLIGTEVALFLAWWACRPRSRLLSNLVAGAFLTGAAASFLIGLRILPASVAALLYLIGALGLLPFAVGATYVSLARRALRWGGASRDARGNVLLLCGAVLPLVVPTAIHVAGRKTLHDAIAIVDSTRPDAMARAVELLADRRWVFNADQLAVEFLAEHDSTRAQRIAELYERSTGEPILEHALVAAVAD